MKHPENTENYFTGGLLQTETADLRGDLGLNLFDARALCNAGSMSRGTSKEKKSSLTGLHDFCGIVRKVPGLPSFVLKT